MVVTRKEEMVLVRDKKGNVYKAFASTLGANPFEEILNSISINLSFSIILGKNGSEEISGITACKVFESIFRAMSVHFSSMVNLSRRELMSFFVVSSGFRIAVNDVFSKAV